MNTKNRIFSREEWTAARKGLLAKEKAFTQERDALSAARRAPRSSPSPRPRARARFFARATTSFTRVHRGVTIAVCPSASAMIGA